MARKQTKRRSSAFTGILVILLAVLATILYPQLTDTPNVAVDGEVLIHVIDVGQADAILLTCADGAMLIDAGENTSASQNALKAYLDGQGITTLDYFVMTHVHADHIGGADVVFQNYTVKNAVLTSDVATTKVYENMLDEMEASGANVIEAVPDLTFSIGELHCRVLAPLQDYGDPNDMSVVLRATFGNTSMMFTGDAEGNLEGESEKDILSTYRASELQSDFYKVGHHGSDTSNSPAFVSAVSPKIAAISCGEGNSYGHPVQSVLDMLNSMGVEVYRTDLAGHLVFVCDGESVAYRK